MRVMMVVRVMKVNTRVAVRQYALLVLLESLGGGAEKGHSRRKRESERDRERERI